MGAWGTAPVVVPEPPNEPTIDFEFVDSRDEDMEPPVDTRAISDRDQVARDLSEEEGTLDEPKQVRVREEEGPRGLEQNITEVTQAQQDQTVKPTQERRAQVTPDKADIGEAVVPNQETSQEEKPQEINVASVTVTPSDAAPSEILQHASSVKEAAVEEHGQVSFDAKRHDLGAYIKELKRKIWINWFPEVEFNYSPVVLKGKTIVEFKIHPDGSISELKAVRHGADDVVQIVLGLL